MLNVLNFGVTNIVHLIEKICKLGFARRELQKEFSHPKVGNGIFPFLINFISRTSPSLNKRFEDDKMII
jgi:hypothetical protein